MEINGLELTLMRINQIEQNFRSIQGTKEPAEAASFNNVLNEKLDINNPNLPESIFIKPFASAVSTPKTEVDGYVKRYAKENNLDENLVKAVIKAESGFNPNAKSAVGAVGLMQLMPSTAKGLGVDNPLDPEQNIAGGTKYLKNLLNRFDGKIDMALAAYNAGPGAVSKYGGVPPYSETQNYVKKVLGYQRQFAGF